MKILTLIAIVLPMSLFAQVTGYDIPEIKVTDSLKHTVDKGLTIKRSSILELQPEDAGELLQKLAGVNVRSYGGLGGLKTVSVRGLGSQHTSIVVDGFTIMNNQTGQINLGQVQSENIERMYLVNGVQRSALAPATAQVSGSAVYIETFEGSFSPNKHAVRFASRLGSYSQFDNYLSYKYSGSKAFVSVFGKFRFADGNYPYVFQNGATTYEGIRNNNRYEDLSAGFNSGYKFKRNGLLALGYRTYNSDQNLPGAVILYSDNAFQTLQTKEHKLQVSYAHHFEKLSIKVFAAAAFNEVVYQDTTFLNNTGGILSTYQQFSLQSGASGSYELTKKVALFFAAEEQNSKLETNSLGLGTPFRNHTTGIIGSKIYLGKLDLVGQLGSQYVQEVNGTITRPDIFRVNPFIQLEYFPFREKYTFSISANYRNSLRMPSFNELYYNSVGNASLKPEDADQFSIGFVHSKKKGNLTILGRASGFYNEVRNKIVAIPTKNLFVWSMQNVGTARIQGLETSLELNYTISKDWTLNLFANYTFQSAVDITDTGSPTFGDQIAYIPKHTANFDLSLKYKKIGIRGSSLSNSLRYSLNENVKANEVPGFMVVDAAVFGSFKWRNHDMRLQFTCKNLFNSSYAIIRYYIMPGRMYLISFNYALH